jgi:hypothetical protein
MKMKKDTGWFLAGAYFFSLLFLGCSATGTISGDGGSDGLDGDGGDQEDGRDAGPDIPVTVFVVPAIQDEKTLPDSSIPERYRSNDISMAASPGEYEPASFVVRAEEDIASLAVEPTDLAGPGGSVIPAANVDIRVVKCWWQAGVSVGIAPNGEVDRRFTPELLLKDDSLVKVENGENYVKINTGEYVWVSEVLALSGTVVVPTSDFPVQDSPTLLPVDIQAGTNKQFWITAKVPVGTPAGDYKGTIGLTTSEGSRQLRLGLKVLPIDLAEPSLTYSIYYRGKLSADWPDGSISCTYKSEAQLRRELQNMYTHGVTNPAVYQGYSESEKARVGRVLSIRNEVGMVNRPLYSLGILTGNSSDPAVLDALKTRVRSLISFAVPYGVTEVFVYGIDEAKAEDLAAERPAWNAVHEAGAKVFVAGYSGLSLPPGVFSLMGDLLDLLICDGTPTAYEAALWHNEPTRPHRIFNYGNPQAGEEKPETYRRHYGLLLWQENYDGAMDYAYQHGFGTVWNDFDSHGNSYRDHNFTYPTVDGVIDTIQWEGFREGVDDVRYLTTLLRLVEEKKAEGKDTSFTENWLTELKGSMLVDFDGIRAKLIEHILYWSGAGLLCGNGVVEAGEECDGADLAGRSCADLGFDGGDLRCKEDCFYNTCGCMPSQLSVCFVEPTPNADSIVTSSEVKIGTSIESSCPGLSGFMDWNDSLVGYWDFNEGQGGTAADKSTHGHACTVNGATWEKGKFGSALRFDGVNDSVTCGDLGIPENGPATIEGWFKLTQFAMEKGAHIPLMTALYQNSGNDDFSISGAISVGFPVASLIKKNEWFHLALTYSGSTRTAVLYIDGIPIEVHGRGAVQKIVALSNFKWGAGTSGSFGGFIDEGRVWNRVLSREEIQASYEAGRYGLRGTFRGLQDGPAHCYATVTNELGQSARTETRNFTVDAP